MSKSETDKPVPTPGQSDWPYDCSREEAAYAKVAEEYARLHLGKVALIYGDQVIGVYDDASDAILDGYRRLGDVPFVVKEIRDPNEPPPYYPHVVPGDPYLRFLEDGHGD